VARVVIAPMRWRTHSRQDDAATVVMVAPVAGDGPTSPRRAAPFTVAVRGRRGVTLALVAAAVMLCASVEGCGGKSSKPAAKGPTWADYFIAHKGRSCVVGNTVRRGGRSVRNRVRQTVVSADRVDGGASVHMRIVTRAIANFKTTRKLAPLTSDLHYLLADDGTLRAAPQVLRARPPFTFALSGFEVYPSIHDLRSGRSSTSELKVKLGSTDSALRSELSDATTSGHELEFEVTTKVAAAPEVPRLVTPAGVYRHIVGVRIHFSSPRVLNAAPGVADQVDPLMHGMASAFGTTDVYFARGVGQVLTKLPGTRLPLLRCN
jgi:hypothetical protein